MKKILLFAIAAMVFSVSYAQDDFGKKTLEQRKQAVKERMELLKLDVKAVDKTLMKKAKKEAKRLTKEEGWQVMAGSLPLEDQLYKVYEKRYTKPSSLWGEPQATGSSLQGARTQTSAMARIEIAEQISSVIAEKTEESLGNHEISDEEATSITSIMKEATQYVEETLGRTVKEVEVYRKLANGNYQVRTIVSYDGNQAKEKVLKFFEQKSSELREKLEKILNEE